MRHLYFGFLFLFTVNSFGNENIFSLQRQGLHDFAQRATKVKDAAELLEQSHLHWHKGFSELQKAAKTMRLVKILVIKNGIEFSIDEKKYSIEATGKVFSFLINGQEFTIDAPTDLLGTTIALRKFVEEKKGAHFSFSLFSRAQAWGWGLFEFIAAAGIGITFSNLLNLTPDENSYILCEADGSFKIHATKKGGYNDQIITYTPPDRLYVLTGFGFRKQPIYEFFQNKLEKLSDGDVGGSSEKAKNTILEEARYVSSKCKESGKTKFDGFEWGKTSLEKKLQGATRYPVRGENPASR